MSKADALQGMRRNGLLDPSNFELRANNREAFVEAVGPLVVVGYEIEGDTASTADVVRLLAPGDHVDLWEAQELWHALMYGEMAIQNEIVLPDLCFSEPDELMQRLDRWRQSSKVVANVLGMVVDIEGYKNEGQNMRAQRRAVERLRKIRAHKLAKAFQAMYAQEAWHSAYYLADLKARRTKHPVEYYIAKYLALRDAKPIGANTPERMARVGGVMVEMFDEGEVEESLEKIVEPLNFSKKQKQRLGGGLEECMLAYKVA